ncbi:MAG: hypothetical protein AB1345_13200 [Chloroflexota bacterium]
MKRYNTFLITAFLVITSLSCQALLPSATEGGESTDLPNVLFQDDFSDPTSGWDRVDGDKASTNYYNDGYRIFVNAPDSDYWANPGLNFTDVRIEVDARKLSGPDDNDFGVLCRYQPDTREYYFFMLTSDGYYTIGKFINGNIEPIGMDSMLPHEAIRTGASTNHIRADCVGNQLTLYANGIKLFETTDDELTNGDVGLIAGTFEEPGTDILFDNFTVLNP